MGKINAADAPLMADPDTLATKNALIRVVNKEGMTGIYRQRPGNAPEPLQFQLEPFAGGNPLQLTIPIPGTVGTIEMVMREEELKGSAAQPFHLGGTGKDHHPLLNELTAGSHRSLPALDLNEAESAAAKGQIGFPNGTETGNIDVVIQSRPEEPFASAGLDLSAIDGQNDFFRYGLLQKQKCLFELPDPASGDIMAPSQAKSVHFTITTSDIINKLATAMTVAYCTEGEKRNGDRDK